MPMRQIEWATPNRQKIETGHKTFDRKTTLITTGNVVGGTQKSSYVRPVSETLCNGVSFEKGHLRKFDLDQFRNLPRIIQNWYANNPNVKTILYEFFHYDGDAKIVHGYVITDDNYNHYKLLLRWSNGRYKSQKIISECITFITEQT